MQAVATTDTVEQNKHASNKLAVLFRSRLARSFMAGFLIIAAIEASFLFVLSVDVQNAERAAAREFDLLHSSQQMSHVISTAQKCIDTAELCRKEPGNEDRFRDYRQAFKQTMAEMDDTIKDFERIKLDTTGAHKLQKSFAELNDILQIVLKQIREGEEKEAYRRILIMTAGLYEEFLKSIQDIHGSLNKSTKSTFLAEIDPQKLLYFAAAINLALAIILMILVEKGITSPIKKLAGNCQRIMQGELMPKPSKIHDEIGALEQSFHDMSLVVSENEKRRHNFLEFFQSVQTAALENVRVCFEALLAEPALQDRARRSIQKARTNLQTLMQLLESMTEALSFNANTTIEPHYGNTISSKLLGDAATAVESLLHKRKIKLTIDDINCNLEIDSHLIGRVLVNFLSNAIKYSPDGAEVFLTMERNGNKVRFKVRDQGPGISEEGQKKLFKEFSQLESADGVKRAGTGLGLLICKQIVEAHGGQVGIESEVGKGSSFWFEIPPQKQLEATSKSQSNSDKSVAEQKTEMKTNAPRRSSIKRSFVIMLLCLLIPQTLIVLKLHSMFGVASQNARSFYVDREVLMRTEELLGLNLVWKLTVAQAVEEMQIEKVAETTPMLDEMVESSRWMEKHTAEYYPARHDIRVIINGFLKLHKFGDYLTKNKDNLNLAVMPKLVGQARKIAREVEHSMFSIMNIGASNVQNTYEGSTQIRNDLMWALGAAAAINFLLLAGISFVAFRITDRIANLKHKAEDFAGGKRLEPSLTGNDELQFLDLRLCQVSQAIKDADSQRQKLIAVINHDLRTPLTSIMNSLEMIMASGYGDLGEREKQLVANAETELEKLLQQINDLLLIEKIDAGLYQLSAERFPVVPILAATAKSFGESALRAGVRLRPEISQECRDICINGDKQLVEREFAIIISNAVQAAPKGSVIDVSLEREGNVVSVKFKDRGPGINEELLPQIFERFRFVNGKPVTGLGLPLAQRLTAIHGGSLEISSSSSGTETRVNLPIAV